MAAILHRAFTLYQEREQERGGNWKRAGCKGMTLNCYAKAERAFHQVMRDDIPNPDHFMDLIVYSAFAMIMAVSGNMNGEWPWPTDSH